MNSYHENLRTTIVAILHELQGATAPTQINTAVRAANVQVAANAVVRLAGDMGSILSMVDAADYGTEIFKQTKQAYEQINSTAYDAELLSQKAMEGAITLSAPLPAQAYPVANQQLNLGLSITSLSAETCTLRFERYPAAFPPLMPAADSLCPVKNYYLIIVKTAKSQTFTISDAESLLIADNSTCKLLTLTTNQKAKVELAVKELRDSDGDALVEGQAYTAFLFMALSDYYKKTLNDFDDLLSAPAAPYIAKIAAKQNDLAGDCKKLADKLIYAVQAINKLANMIIRRKALNPLISDNLITLIGTAGLDANNAVR